MFDVKAFLRDNFQSASGVIAHCRAAGVEPPNQDQADKWLQRNSIPGAWLATLLLILEGKQGEPVSVRRWFGRAP
jgi:hypothetical protein